MSASDVDHSEGDAQTVMFLCDGRGQILGGNQGALAFAGQDAGLHRAPGESAGGSWRQKHFSELFGLDSGLSTWLNGRLDETARKPRSECTIDYKGVSLQAILELVSTGEENQLYCLRLSEPPRIGPNGIEGGLPDGATLVSRQEWHDIKNYLGGLKLYATFLKKKLVLEEDQQIVDKMVSGINGIIDYFAKIRRGEGS